MKEKVKNIPFLTIIYYILVVVLIIIRCRIQTWLPIWANGNNYHDDMLLNNYANTIRQGLWLGDYGSGTLAKVPGYGIFLVFNDWIGLPYMVTAALFYSLGSFCMLLALQKLFKKKWLPFLTFLFLLFSPVYFEVTVAARLYCVSLIPSIILYMFAGVIGTFAERKNNFSRRIPWLILLGLAHGSYAWLRADVVWMSCFVWSAVAILIVEGIIRRERKRVLFFFIPVVIYFGFTNLLCAINNHEYGIYAMSDFTETGFADMCKALMTIKPTEEIDGCYVSLDTMERVAEISNTFVPLYEQIAQDSKAAGMYGAEFYAWEIRGAMQAIGYYKDATSTNEFYEQVTKDIEQAFEEGVFEKRDALVLSSFVGPIRKNEIGNIVLTTIDNIMDSVITYGGIHASMATYSGPELSYNIMSDLTNTEFIVDTIALKFRGWMFATEDGSTVEAYLYDNDGNQYPIQFQENLCVFDALNQTYENAKKSYYDITWTGYDYNTKDLGICVVLDGKVIYDGKLAEFTDFEQEGFLMNVDELVIGELPEQTRLQLINMDHHIKQINEWISFYQKTGLFVAIITMMLFAADFIYQIYLVAKRKENQLLFWILKAGVLLALFTLTFVVHVHDLTYTDAFGTTYGIGAYTIWQVFVVVNVLTVGLWIQRGIGLTDAYELLDKGRRKLRDSEKRKIIIAVVLLVYLVVSIIAAFHHEFWRDEAQAWCLVRDSSFIGVLKHLKAEGHPILWFAVLFPFAHAGLPIETLSVICIVIMMAAAYLLLNYAPFPAWMKIFVMISSIMLYYNTSICRIYSLIILLLFAIAACYKKRLEKPWRYMILVALLLQSHIIMAGLAIMLWLCYLFEAFGVKEEKGKTTGRLAGLIPPFSIICLIVELSGGGQMSYAAIIKNICLMPVNSIQRFLEQFSFGIGESIGQALPAWVFYVLFFTFVLLAVCHWTTHWREIMILTGGLGGQIFIAAFIYGLIKQRAVILFATIIFGYWICSVKAGSCKMQCGYTNQQKDSRYFEDWFRGGFNHYDFCNAGAVIWAGKGCPAERL